MELVYLWVEDYKNIQKQGFNFSSRFRCEYDEKKNELEIVDKEKTDEFYPKNFFGDNINVTAIVGENGSGKSSVLELLPYGGESIDANKLIFLLFKKADEFILLKPSSKEIKIDKKFKVKEEDITKEDFSKSNEIERIMYDTDFTKEKISDRNVLRMIDSISNDGLLYKQLFWVNKNKNFNIEKYLQISNNLIYNLRNELIHLDDFFKPSYIQILHQGMHNKEINIEEIIEKMESEVESNKFNREKINELRENEFLKTLHYEQKIFIQDFEKLSIVFKPEIQDYLVIDIFNEKNISFREFSQGERNFYNHFLFLIFIDKNYSNSSKNENTFFLLDEPDTTFHPNWQKKYINQLLNIYKNYKKNIHLIITSHSPFILSDFPKENIIFLEKGKQVYPFEDGKQTFGANIHTLLSHGFFMKDGLMGEFAKSKIDDVINYLNNDKKSTITTDKDAQNIINIIGEPIIKRELQRMLKNKMELSNKTEIDKIREKVDKLTKELEESSKRLVELEKKEDK